MESHEEKLANMIRQSKEREAQQEMVRKAKQISRENRSKGMGGSGGGIGSMRDFADDLRSGAAQVQAQIESTASALPSLGGEGGGGYGGGYSAPPKKGTGMKLGSKTGGMGGMGGASLLQAMAAEGEVVDAAPARGGMPAVSAGPAAPGGGAAGISLVADEKLAITMSRDGGLQSMEVKGDLQLLVSDPSLGKAVVPLTLGANPGFQFKTHPNINKVHPARPCLKRLPRFLSHW